MSIGQIIVKGAAQTSSGQPITEGGSANAVEPTAGSAGSAATSTETNVSVAATAETPPVEGATATATETAGAAGTPITVDIPPEALRQITVLSQGNRKLRAEVAELKTKAQAATPAADVEAKLARLAELEAALTSPRKFLALSKKTLEEVAQDVYEANSEIAVDPRVDELKTTQDATAKELAALKAEQARRDQAAQADAQKAGLTRAYEYAKGVVTANAGRWENIAKDPAIGQAATEAAMKVITRDFSEIRDAQGTITRAERPLDKATADSILEDCLDRAEAFAVAEKIVKERKNGGQTAETPVLKRSTGITFRNGESPGVEARKPSPPTIDDTRGATRLPSVQRGQTDVRTARRRAMEIANRGDDK